MKSNLHLVPVAFASILGLCAEPADADTCCQYQSGATKTCTSPTTVDTCADVNNPGVYNNNYHCDGNTGTCEKDCKSLANGSDAACADKHVNFGCAQNKVCEGTGAAPVACTCTGTPVPTLSEWGIVVMALLTACAATVVIMRRMAHLVA